MQRRTLGLLLILSSPTLFASAQPEGDPLLQRADRALAVEALRGAQLAALVIDATDGSILFAREPDRALIPASNQKLLTALAALDHFGPTHRFTTSVQADALPGPEGSVSSLYIRGGGDPALTSENWWRLAADLRRSGLRRVGDLVLDDGAFDTERWHPSWGAVSSRAYHAPIGALAANYGAFAVEVQPGPGPGRSARVALDPPVPYLELQSLARTGPPGRPTRLVVERQAGEARERVAVSGLVASRSPERIFYRSVANPTLYAGAVLRWQLRAHGIEVAGTARRGRVPESAVEILAFEGRPLGEIARLFLKYSNNMIAEALVKAMGSDASGEPGSWPAGMAELERRLRALGLSLDGARLVDGSGLSRENRVAPRLLTEALLVARRSFDFGPELIAALPIASADGTLEDRAEGAAGEVRGKTGLLDRVVSLSGYARSEAGRELVFSLLVNGFRSSDAQAMRAVDGFAQALVGARSSPGARDSLRSSSEAQESVLTSD
jgi:D-alanyl-D-alanine carboxypeptidase/D-alanyl-D-alanine-endopeptidase (penicillin-binding protein 4)